MSNRIHKNLSLRMAVKLARELGVTVFQNAKGEVHFRRKGEGYSRCVRRKDAGRELVAFLRRVERKAKVRKS